MGQNFSDIIETYLTNNKQISFNLSEIEGYIINKLGSLNAYINSGGTTQLKEDILSLKKEGKINLIKSKQKDVHLSLNLPNYWRKNKNEVEEKWERSYILSKMGKIDLSYFIKNPKEQTVKNKERVDAIYSFLEESELKEIVTTEERMYELFHKEKWLQPEPNGENGRAFLSKINVSIEDLKAKKFPEPIPYETRERIPLNEVKHILITENNSFYHSIKRCLEFHKEIAGIPVDMIVYGRGKQTIANLEYLYTLFEDATKRQYYYVGDIDPEGFSIFARVKRKYHDLPITIAKSIYIKMMDDESSPPKVDKNQQKNRDDFDLFLQYFNKEQDGKYREFLEELWERNRRIPQEVLNYETLLRKG